MIRLARVTKIMNKNITKYLNESLNQTGAEQMESLLTTFLVAVLSCHVFACLWHLFHKF